MLIIVQALYFTLQCPVLHYVPPG